MKLLRRISNYLPERSGIRNVFAVIVVLIYSWTLFTWLYKFPSWLYFLNLTEIASVYAYSLAVDLVDSLVLLGFVLLMEIGLISFFGKRDEFQARSIIFILTVLGSLILRLTLHNDYEEIELFVKGEVLWWAVTLAAAVFLGIFLPKVKRLKIVLENWADRAVIFLYIYLPLSAVSLIVVLIRNLD